MNTETDYPRYRVERTTNDDGTESYTVTWHPDADTTETLAEGVTLAEATRLGAERIQAWRRS